MVWVFVDLVSISAQSFCQHARINLAEGNMIEASANSRVRSCALSSPSFLILASVVCALGMWLYLLRVVIPNRVLNAAIHGRPRGSLSDLYPRWLGARELLLRGRNPYSDSVTREIQAGFYGRPLDPSRPDDLKDEPRFAHPLYVVFILAPTVGLPFEIVQTSFFWIFLAITMASVPLWLRVLKWRPSWPTQVSLILLTIGSPAVMQGLKLCQLSLLVAALIVAAMVLLTSDRLIAAGALLALATIKPQLVCLLLLWLAFWTASDWKHRYRLALSFVVTMTALEFASEVYLPHWFPLFWQAIREYQRHTSTASMIDRMISPLVGTAIALLSLAMAGLIGWKGRVQPADSPAFARVLSMVLAVTALVAPPSAPYNQVLLLPAVLLLVRGRGEIWQGGIAGQFLIALTVFATGWP
jgi:hypothetical protein